MLADGWNSSYAHKRSTKHTGESSELKKKYAPYFFQLVASFFRDVIIIFVIKLQFILLAWNVANLFAIHSYQYTQNDTSEQTKHKVT